MPIGIFATLAPLEVLSHGWIPYRSRPRYLRLVRTKDHALDYAAGGFHVSVARGKAGGCSDDAIVFGQRGAAVKPVECQFPLGRDDLVQLWAQAASAYGDTFGQIQSGNLTLDQAKDELRRANALADQAYAAEGVEPPRDPKIGTPEPPCCPRNWGYGVAAVVLGLGTAAIVHTHQRNTLSARWW